MAREFSYTLESPVVIDYVSPPENEVLLYTQDTLRFIQFVRGFGTLSLQLVIFKIILTSFPVVLASTISSFSNNTSKVGETF